MTEAVENTTEATEAIEANPNSYENIRDGSPIIRPETRQKWQLADKMKLRLRQEYDRLLSNEELVASAKQEKAQNAYERANQKIVGAAHEARDALLRDASTLEWKAKPWPHGEAKNLSNNSERLSLAYSESERLVRLAEKRSQLKSGQPNPMFHVGDFLRNKYLEGITVGGVQGSALCHGVLRAAEELGVDEHEVIDALRTDEQREQFDSARLLAHYAQTVDTSVPQIPRGLSGEGRRSPIHGLTASPSGQRASSRKPAWK